MKSTAALALCLAASTNAFAQNYGTTVGAAIGVIAVAVKSNPVDAYEAPCNQQCPAPIKARVQSSARIIFQGAYIGAAIGAAAGFVYYWNDPKRRPGS